MNDLVTIIHPETGLEVTISTAWAKQINPETVPVETRPAPPKAKEAK